MGISYNSGSHEMIKNNFKYHKPRKDQLQHYESIRSMAKDFALYIDDSCLDSREKSLALTKLEECVMWANASIARNK